MAKLNKKQAAEAAVVEAELVEAQAADRREKARLQARADRARRKAAKKDAEAAANRLAQLPPALVDREEEALVQVVRSFLCFYRGQTTYGTFRNVRAGGLDDFPGMREVAEELAWFLTAPRGGKA
jgi:hypothetical protein